jgi:molecular chaperone Hsp33
VSKRPDMLARAITDDGAFRVITLITTQTVREAARMQEARGTTARRLGELITGAILVREAMSPDRRVQALIKDGKGRTCLVADAHPTGWNRGIVNPGPEGGAQSAEGGAILEVLYTLPNDVLHQGIVALPASGDISSGFMTYMQESEQVVSMITVRAVVDEDVRAAGGYMVQLLPDAPREAVQRMIDQLSGFEGLDDHLLASDATAEGLSQALLGGIAIQPMARTYLCFGCNCDRERVLAGLSSLPGDEIGDMLDQGEALDIRCDACGEHYEVTTADLRALLDARSPVRSDGDSVQN